MATTQRTCSFDGCERPHNAHGYCRPHVRQQRHGKILTAVRPVTPRGSALIDRLNVYTDKTGDCWLWTGARNSHGYGHVNVNGKMHKAHRLAYELANGTSIAGVVVDHMCHTPACVRPGHLQAVSQKENCENRSGGQLNNTSGARGVSWDKPSAKYRVRVRSGGRDYFGGNFANLAEAEATAIALRNRLHTNNLLDRAA